jgi:hypothetical protein
MISAWKAKASTGVQSRVLLGRRENSEGASARAFVEGPVVPRWLVILHRLVSLAVFLAICLVTVALVATLVHAGRLCYERTVHTTHSLRTSVPSIRSALGERSEQL